MSNLEEWHRTLSHINSKDLRDLRSFNLVDGLLKTLEKDLLKCEICLESKMSNLKLKNNRSRASEVLEIIHTDVHGPITQAGYNGEKCFVSFIDDFSKFSGIYCIKSKRGALQIIMEFNNYVKMFKITKLNNLINLMVSLNASTEA